MPRTRIRISLVVTKNLLKGLKDGNFASVMQIDGLLSLQTITYAVSVGL